MEINKCKKIQSLDLGLQNDLKYLPLFLKSDWLLGRRKIVIM